MWATWGFGTISQLVLSPLSGIWWESFVDFRGHYLDDVFAAEPWRVLLSDDAYVEVKQLGGTQQKVVLDVLKAGLAVEKPEDFYWGANYFCSEKMIFKTEMQHFSFGSTLSLVGTVLELQIVSAFKMPKRSNEFFLQDLSLWACF